MKRSFLFLGPVLFLGPALSVRLLRPSAGAETDCPSALAGNDTICYLSVQEAGQIPERAIVGTISSETDTFPRKNGQANCCPPGTPAAETEGARPSRRTASGACAKKGRRRGRDLRRKIFQIVAKTTSIMRTL